MQFNPLEQNGAAITTADLDALRAHAVSGNFTEFYVSMHSFGSAMAGLYIPGPAGVGIFGAYSHLISSQATSTQFFQDNQYDISTAIASAVINLIETNPTGDGGFYLPSVHRLLAEEIGVFENFEGLGSEAYAGHDMIEFLNITGVPGAIDGGVQGSNILDGITAWSNSVFGDGEFEYANATLNEDDIYRDGNIYRIEHPTLGDIAIGITPWYTVSLINSLSEEIAVRQNPENYLNSTFYQISGYQGISALRDGKFIEIMNSVYGDAETNLSDGGVVVFNEDGTLTVIEESYLARQYSFLEVGDECFTPGTQINLFDGSSRAIEDITVGDLVLSYDVSGNPVAGHVERTFTNTTPQFVVLDFEDGRAPLTSTPGHRFLSETGDYEEIGTLLRLGGGKVRIVDQSGAIVTARGELVTYSAETADQFAQADAQSVAFLGNTALKPQQSGGWQTHNFEVRDHHNYVAGDIRVHNDSILTNLQSSDVLLSVDEDLTNAAVLRDVDGNGTADFVTLEGFRDVDNGIYNTQLEKLNVKYWDAANGDLEELLADVVANSPVATSTVFDPGVGNNWNDGTWGDDIEEAFFDDVLGASGDGVGHSSTFSLYDETIAYVDGVPVIIPDVTGATDPITLLASLSGLITVIDGLAPGSLDYDAGDGDVFAPAFEGVSGVAAIAFLLGVDLSFELFPAVTIDGPFGPIEVTPAVTLGSLLDGEVGNQTQFNVAFGEGISSSDVSQAQDEDNLVLTIDNGDGTTSTLTLEDVYTDGNANEVAGLTFADGTSVSLDEVPETTSGDGVVTGSDGNDLIDGSYVDVDGDTVTATVDNVVAGLGDDTLAGGEGDDTLDGGQGVDTVLLDGTWDEFVFASESGLTVTDTNTTSGVNEGKDTLIDIEALNFSDGTSAEITADEDSTTVAYSTAEGAQLARTVLDTANTRAWTDYTTTFGPDGSTRTDQVFNYDDGRTLDRDYDESGIRTSQTMTDDANVHAWTDYTTTFGPDGSTRTDQVFNYDDGRTLDRDYDESGIRTSQTLTDDANVHAWTDYTTTFGPDGSTRTDQVFNYDDGRTLDRDYDESGIRTSQTLTDDANVHAWTDYTTTFGPDGSTRTDQVFNYDDGRTLDRDYDESGIRTSQMMTDVEDAYSWASYTQTFDASGNLLDTVYVDDLAFV